MNSSNLDLNLSGLRIDVGLESGLLKLPTEMHLDIIGYISQIPDGDSETLRSLAHTSKHFYTLCFQERFESIILGPMAIKVFQEGGLVGAQGRKYVRALRFEKPWDTDWKSIKPLSAIWMKPHSKEPMEEYFASICASIEALNLDLFPNVRKLSISYFLPKCAVNNVFVAALRGIAGSSFLNILEELEIQVFDKLAFEFSDLSYTEFYEKLSESHQELLISRELYFDRVWLWIKTVMPELPALKVLKIFHSSIASPLDQFETVRFFTTAFFYLLLMLAPRLDELHIGSGNPELRVDYEPDWPFDSSWETYTDWHDLGLDNGISKRHKGDREYHLSEDFTELSFLVSHHISFASFASFAPELLKRFSKITRLKIFHPLSREYLNFHERLDIVAERFPNLRSFELGTSKIGSCNNLPSSSSSYIYFGIGQLKYLRDVTLPWPKIYGETVQPQCLPYLWEDWLGVNVKGLETVVFSGVDREHKYIAPRGFYIADYKTYVQTRVGFKVKLAEGGRDCWYQVVGHWVEGNLSVNGSCLTKPLDFSSRLPCEWGSWWRESRIWDVNDWLENGGLDEADESEDIYEDDESEDIYEDAESEDIYEDDEIEDI
ncbi:hypothetical protein AOL_s00215g675 [Orbilia oligospora ATCC 24927]|uniref:Uncharacterized protein n=1 Tax=Arthrobotrys oligospora (strain ATCC 24927 / CBS 115.81 / DSM 1491) TaxID=756982 RepID=G1XUL7_ARTOA|nr:hypothetical protein AOL_s00215g675 [Orbilia oligospora ATCC 24927]EGX43219.1 hypothetical protein AOL_s00215g675 [Orbilia oligospora ATCC 24927]